GGGSAGGCRPPRGRRNVDLGDDAPPARVAEAHLDHRPLPRLLRDLVGERARDGARCHERIDGGVPGHRAERSPGYGRCIADVEWNPDTYLDEMHAEIPGYDELQHAVAAATRGLDIATVLELGTGTGETALHVLAEHPAAR